MLCNFRSKHADDVDVRRDGQQTAGQAPRHQDRSVQRMKSPEEPLEGGRKLRRVKLLVVDKRGNVRGMGSAGARR